MLVPIGSSAWARALTVAWVILDREIPRCTIGNHLYAALVLIDLTEELP